MRNNLQIFSKKIFFEKRENIYDFWKENKMKGGNKDTLLSGRDRYTAENYITTLIFPLIPFVFNVINGLF